MQIEFNARKRDAQGTGASRRLRRTSRVPGILYGGPNPAQPIELDHNEIFQKLRQEAFHSSVLNINVDGAKQMCLLRDVQWHPFKLLVLHVDFQRVDATQKLHQKVPLHFINAEQSPGVKVQGGVVSHVMTEINVSCLAQDLPGFIEVDLSEVASGHSLHVSHVKFPAGVTPVLHKNEDPVVATIMVPRSVAADEAATAATAAAAPAAAPAAASAEKK
jgi:large subunit ribosomal protein L25